MKRNRAVPYLMLSPFFLLYVVFFVYSLCYAFYLSLFASQAGETFFVGLQNYIQALHDKAFWSSIALVVAFALMQAVTILLVALVLALLLDSPAVKGKALFRLIYFLPYAVPGVIATIMWGFLYSPQLDPILKLVASLRGGKPVDLLNTRNLLYGILNIATWEWTGYNMTLYFAGLTALPLEIYDAAKIDGCSEIQTALRIKIPLLRSIIVFTSVLSMIGSLQLFNEPLLLGSLTTSPSSYTPNLYIYNMAFRFSNFHYSSTLSFSLALITLAASLLFLFLTGVVRFRRPSPAMRSGSAP